MGPCPPPPPGREAARGARVDVTLSPETTSSPCAPTLGVLVDASR